MHKVTITTQTKPKDGGEGKTRSFSAQLHSYILANDMWAGGLAKTDKKRPVWARFVGADSSLRAFAANLQQGRVAEQESASRYSSRAEAKFEFQRSAGYEYTWQKTEHGTVLTVALPEVLSMDPGIVDASAVRFVLLTPRWWAEQYSGPGDEHGDTAQAQRFLVYLRNRTRKPVINTKEFAAFLYERALREGIAQNKNPRQGFVIAGDTDDLLPPTFVNVTQVQMDQFLAGAVKAWYTGAEPVQAAA